MPDDNHKISLEKYGPWAVVAGASEGSGEQFSRQLAAAGFNLLLVARRHEPLDRLAAELRQQNAVDIRTLALDLTREDAAETMFAAAADIEVGLYVSNAGSDMHQGTFLSRPLEKAVAIINLNVRTVTSACYLFLGPMSARRRGGIVLMSSVSALVGGQPGAGLYSATKAFDLTLAESLWSELREQNIDVIGIGVPPMATPTLLEYGISFGDAKPYDPAEVVSTSLAQLGKVPSYIFNFIGVDTEPGEVTAAARHQRLSAVKAGFNAMLEAHKRRKP
jgi:short-subunit dehydrogenase